MNENHSNTAGYLQVEHVKYFNDRMNYMNFEKPILVEHGCADMAAVSKWTPEYLNHVLADTIVHVEEYDSRDHMGMTNFKTSTSMAFNQYMKRMMGNGPPYYYFAEQSVRQYVDVDIAKDEHDSKTSIILQDIECGFDRIREPEDELFFLGKDTRSGCHLHVHGDYVLNQIIGKKTLYLFDFSENKDMNMNAFWSENCNFTKFNLFDMDHSKLKLYKVVLNPGNSLLIPPWWFHAVEGHGVSCSITKIYERKNRSYLLHHPYLLFLIIIEHAEEGLPYAAIILVAYFMWYKIYKRKSFFSYHY